MMEYNSSGFYFHVCVCYTYFVCREVWQVTRHGAHRQKRFCTRAKAFAQRIGLMIFPRDFAIAGAHTRWERERELCSARAKYNFMLQKWERVINYGGGGHMCVHDCHSDIIILRDNVTWLQGHTAPRRRAHKVDRKIQSVFFFNLSLLFIYLFI